jgi:hypothetical protein
VTLKDKLEIEANEDIVLGAAGLTDFLKKNCQQNIACCQDTSSEAVSLTYSRDEEQTC